jgi:hypothetical protein
LPRLLENVNFPKTVAVLASVFGVSLGLCGMTAFASLSLNRIQSPFIAFFRPFFPMAGVVELIAMALSAVGLVVVSILWVISSAVGGFGHGNDPQKLFDGSDDGSGKDSRE